MSRFLEKQDGNKNDEQNARRENRRLHASRSMPPFRTSPPRQTQTDQSARSSQLLQRQSAVRAATQRSQKRCPRSSDRNPAPQPAIRRTPPLKPAPKPTCETVSLIDETKPRAKRTAEERKQPSASVLPPISRIRATPEVTPGPAPEAPPTKARTACSNSTPAAPAAEGAQRRQRRRRDGRKIIHIKPPIIVKESRERNSD